MKNKYFNIEGNDFELTPRFWLHTLGSTVFVFAFMWVAFNFFTIFDFLDPVEEALEDFESSDIVFSQLRNQPSIDSNIVLVNFGRLSRAGIGEQIRILNKYDPAVIGIDAFFITDKSPEEDDYFELALSEVKNLVMVSRIFDADEETGIFQDQILSNPRFNQYAVNAYANFISSAESQDDFKLTRTFSPREYLSNGNQTVALGVKLAEYISPTKVTQFLDRNQEVEIINYKGNIIDDKKSDRPKYYALDVADVFEENFDAAFIKDKILLFGYLGREFGDTSWEDKFFTPLNNEYVGRTSPDMYGVVIHANIISMILNKDFINSNPEWMSTTLGILMLWVNAVIFGFIFLRIPRWYDGLTKVIAIIQIFFFIGLILFVFAQFNYKLDLTLGIIAIAFSSDVIEFYHGVLRNLKNKETRKEIFKENEFIK
ncbi:MAG: CHASE2 domain-containing protein [Cyclobacteriaceae bacterium]|nr:CHASE2 domain-containing protein [Cyclobacteriaceae bacterium]MCH8515556.1 CHASE2 domain-containing protein [Cyclobacteriaceae bacterium]